MQQLYVVVSTGIQQCLVDVPGIIMFLLTALWAGYGNVPLLIECCFQHLCRDNHDIC